jgi:bisphosphoglycerate-independent phosphoglycerate mutase (AlkP superfamily)
VAPTILELMHLPQPKEMTGHSLLHDKPEALRASAQ